MSETERALVQALRTQRAFGKYRGHVVDNEDPQRLGRLRVRVPALLGDAVTAWALPCMPCGGAAGHGWFCVPEVGAQVWVEFEGGDLNYPIWVGTFWQQPSDVPQEVTAQTTTRLFRTAGGHVLMLEDAVGGERILLQHAGGASLEIDPDGTVALTDQGGARLSLDAAANRVVLEDAHGNTLALSAAGASLEDAHGNRLEMAAPGVRVQAGRIVIEGSQVLLGGEGGEPLIKGQSFLTLFATHVHTCTGPGSPSSPPIPQGEMSTLSMKVRAG
ncbi:MAG: phage baseplate assembly protein V [Burkholderiales bacterium]|nr:phage baseplate assembly protein V [Burkholderiales bacterium]